jgi:hypothetical protein
MRAAVADDLPQASPAIVALSGFIMVCLMLLVVEVAYLSRDHGAAPIAKPAYAHMTWRTLTL